MFEEYDDDPKPFRIVEPELGLSKAGIEWRARIVSGFLLVAILAIGYFALFHCRAAWAHEALPTAAQPQGWSYPFSCCSGYDCREVPASAISERPEGYVINGTGEVLSYSDTRLKDSPDGEYHWCSVAGANNSRTICLFRPPMGF